MTITGIDTVAVVVSDKQKALQWYRDILGLRVAYVGPFEPNTDASVQGSPDRPGHWIELGPGRPLIEPGPTGITFLTDNIRTDYDRLRSKGVRFLYPPRRMEWGEWLCEFADAYGNQFDLKQPVPPAKSKTKLT